MGILPGVVFLAAAQVGPVVRGEPQHVVLLEQVPGEEQVGAEQGRVGRYVAQGQVEVATVLGHQLERLFAVQVVLDQGLGAHLLPLEAAVQFFVVLRRTLKNCFYFDTQTNCKGSWES